jgi:LPXTG-site transpeptidase (sortase) family protein
MKAGNIRFIIFGATLLVGVFLLFFLYHQTSIITVKNVNDQNITEAHVASAQFSGRLEIPSIGIDAKIEDVGLTQDGAVDTPVGPEDVGWYSLGPRPGEEGSAVIDGHRSWKDGEVAVFDNLVKFHSGDTFSVVDDTDGKILSFIVEKTRIYDKNAIVPDGEAHLNLITCVGDWYKNTKSSSERWVVYADLIK